MYSIRLTNSRLEDIVNGCIDWAMDVSDQTAIDMINGAGITREELDDLGWDESSMNFINEFERIER